MEEEKKPEETIEEYTARKQKEAEAKFLAELAKKVVAEAVRKLKPKKEGE